MILDKLKAGHFVSQFLTDEEQLDFYRNYKYPILTRGIGLELELVTTDEELLIHLQRKGFVVDKPLKAWVLTGDMSLNSEFPSDYKYNKDVYRQNRELISPILFGEEVLSIKTLCDVLNEINPVINAPTAFVNDSCGLHVHISVEGNTEEERKSIYYCYAAIRDQLFKVIYDKRLTSRWAKKNDNTYEDALNDNCRYKDINLKTRNKNTFEYRISHPTLDPNHIISWALILHAIHEYGEEHNCTKDSKLNLYDVLQYPILWNYYNEQHHKLVFRERKKEVPEDKISLSKWIKQTQ